VSIKNSLIARNGVAGVQANGASAGVHIATRLLDQNAAGATTVVNGRNLFTYGNIVGSLGSGDRMRPPIDALRKDHSITSSAVASTRVSGHCGEDNCQAETLNAFSGGSRITYPRPQTVSM
jgi:hypothetical protein